MSYDKRVSRLELQTLDLRRIQIPSDLITCYKLLNREVDIDRNSFTSV